MSFSKSRIPIDFDVYQIWHSQQSSSLANGMSVIDSAPNPFIISNNPRRLGPASRNGIDTTLGDMKPPAPYPTSFSQIVELITSGEPIPGIKEVSDTVLEGQASQSTTVKRKKPWEMDDAVAGEEIVRPNDAVPNLA